MSLTPEYQTIEVQEYSETLEVKEYNSPILVKNSEVSEDEETVKNKEECKTDGVSHQEFKVDEVSSEQHKEEEASGIASIDNISDFQTIVAQIKTENKKDVEEVSDQYCWDETVEN